MARNPEGKLGHNGHYSDQTGHWWRGQVEKARILAESQGLPLPRGNFPAPPSDKVISHVTRRSMRTTPQSGRK